VSHPVRKYPEEKPVDLFAGEQPLKFIHLSDLHLVPKGDKLWGLDPFARLEACLADIVKLHSDAAFVVISGDLAEKGEVLAYRQLKARLADFPIETHVMLGNHDDRSHFLSVFTEGPTDEKGFVQSAISREGARFLFLDTLKGPPSSAGRYCADRQAWLKAELAAAGKQPLYLFMHHPPFAIAHDLMDMIKLDDAEDFLALLHGHPVRHIFFGHAHRPISGQFRGMSFSAPPSLVHQLPLVSESVATIYSDEPAMYAVVHANADKVVVHMDAFLNRHAADMHPEAERETWF
jgi:3',5'-cyclic-AMP phosphodiesterase